MSVYMIMHDRSYRYVLYTQQILSHYLLIVEKIAICSNIEN